MKIVILGAGGMIGQKLARALVDRVIGKTKYTSLLMHDIIFPTNADKLGDIQIGNITSPGEVERVASERPDLIFHLASVVSGQAEKDFDIGWEVNLNPTWRLLNALKEEHLLSERQYIPKFIFTSSIAVFGGPYPDKITDDFICFPQTSYGSQKLICETMISDFSRKGFIDGVSLRLPTICVRPGKANQAASSFFSGIIREPLNGHEAILPVPDSVRHWHASPRTAINFLLHATNLDFNKIGRRRSINLPGVSCTIAEQIEALRDVAGNEVVNRIKVKENEAISRIVSEWPQDFDAARALKLGFTSEKSFSEIIKAYIDDDLGVI